MRSSRLLRWLNRTPVQTFILCPLLVVAFELAWQRGRLVIMPAGFTLLAWGYLQYLLVGRFRNRLGGGGPGFGVPPGSDRGGWALPLRAQPDVSRAPDFHAGLGA